jgi:hypothetical protein
VARSDAVEQRLHRLRRALRRRDVAHPLVALHQLDLHAVVDPAARQVGTDEQRLAAPGRDRHEPPRLAGDVDCPRRDRRRERDRQHGRGRQPRAHEREQREHRAEHQVLGPHERAHADQRAGREPCPRRAAVAGPQERERRARHGHLSERLAQQPAGVEHERRVRGRQEAGDETRPGPAQAAAEQVADDDRHEPEQRDRQPREPGMHASCDQVHAGVEQRRAGRPVVRAVGARHRELLVGVQQRGDPLVADRVGPLVGGVDRVEDPDQSKPETQGQLDAEQHKHDAAVALGQRPDARHGRRF